MVEFLLLQFQRPGQGPLWPIAVLLFEPANDKLYIRGREGYDGMADVEDVEVLIETVKQLHEEATIQSGTEILEALEKANLSNSIRLTERIAFSSPDPHTTLTSLAKVFLS